MSICRYAVRQLLQNSANPVYELTPINTVLVYDSNNNLQATVTPQSVTYSEGTISISFVFTAKNNFTIGYLLIGSTYKGTFREYFKDTSLAGTNVVAGDEYAIQTNIQIMPGTTSYCPSPLSPCVYDIQGLIDVIGKYLSNDGAYVGTGGQLLNTISIVTINPKNNEIIQSYVIPVTKIYNVGNTLFVAGEVAKTIEGNGIILNDFNGNMVFQAYSQNYATTKFKKGRLIIIEIDFQC